MAAASSPSCDESHLLADGIPPLQHLVHEALIDNRDARTGREIGGIERATGENRSLQHVEVRRLDARDSRLAERRSWIRARDAGRLGGDCRVIGKLDVGLGAGGTRKPVHEGDAGDPWLRCNAPAQLLDAGRERSALRDAGRIGVRSRDIRSIHLDPHRQILLGGESGLERLDVAQLPLLDVDDRGKCHRDRDLHDDHRGPDAAELQSAGSGRGLLQAGSHASRDLERRHHPRDRGAEHGEPDGEQHRRGRQAEIEPEGEPAQVHLEKLQPPVAEGEIGGHEADHRRNASEHERLGEHLHDDPAATRSEGAAHDELALARRGAREQEKGDVAADEHEQHDREEVDREEDPEVLARRLPRRTASRKASHAAADVRAWQAARWPHGGRASSAPPAPSRGSRRVRARRRP